MAYGLFAGGCAGVLRSLRQTFDLRRRAGIRVFVVRIGSRRRVGGSGIGDEAGRAGGWLGWLLGRLIFQNPFFSLSLLVSFASLFVVSDFFLRFSSGCCVASHSFYLLHFTSRSSHSPCNRHLSSLLSSNISSRLAISFALSMRRLSPSFPSPSLLFINVPDRSLLRV